MTGFRLYKACIFPYHKMVVRDKEKRRLYNIEYQRKKRLDPKYRESQRLYFKKRREEPEFKARNKIYLQKYRKKKGVKEKEQQRSREWYKNKKNTQALDRLFNSTLVLE